MQEVENRHFARFCIVREELCDLVGKRQPALLDQLEDQNRGVHLGERADLERRKRRDRLAVPILRPRAAGKDHVLVRRDQDACADLLLPHGFDKLPDTRRIVRLFGKPHVFIGIAERCRTVLRGQFFGCVFTDCMFHKLLLLFLYFFCHSVGQGQHRDVLGVLLVVAVLLPGRNKAERRIQMLCGFVVRFVSRGKPFGRSVRERQHPIQQQMQSVPAVTASLILLSDHEPPQKIAFVDGLRASLLFDVMSDHRKTDRRISVDDAEALHELTVTQTRIRLRHAEAVRRHELFLFLAHLEIVQSETVICIDLFEMQVFIL